ncbi:MAG: Hsp70 family protein [Deltaproteobacteria bacterium]|nr:Hsp70 family protein [Deltaproteobacteria bacterium]
MQRTSIDFGIDLGTTNSTVAVIDNIDAKVIPNKGGSGLTPSAVWIDKRGSIHVGQEAKLRALVDDQDNADLEFKLRMGLGAEGKKVFARSDRKMLPEELSAEVLKSLKMDVQTNMGEELRAAVITVPAAFENPSTNATQKAAQLAGLGRSPILLEPVAASLAYGFQSESENVYWFVYDFGGGTFDAAIMRLRDGLIQVVDHDGENFLGGKLIDWDIVTKKLIPAAAQQFNLPDFRRGNPRWKVALGKMKYYAEQAKIEVCRSKAPYEVWIEGLCQDADGKDVDFSYTLTPADVQEVSRPFIEKSLTLCRKTLQSTGLRGANMERILMVGGTTLNPWVREAVEAELGSRLEFGIDPGTVVARGAAIFASTQELRDDGSVRVPVGTWRIQIEHKPVGNVPDPDIGGRILAPNGQSIEGFTIELVDTKTQWRSGRITLGAEGVFMTQLYAEKQRRHEYAIELCDVTGTRIPTAPDHVSYTLGVIPEENPPAAMTIGVGLANGSVATYIKKGTRLPARKSMEHYTTVLLRTGHAEDELRIPLLEGEHPRAERNHGIGVMTIKGSDIRRDLPVGSDIDIALMMDQSQQVRLQAYVKTLDEDFEISFDPQMKHNSLAELRKEAQEQKTRLANAREKAEQTKALKALAAVARIEDLQLLRQVDSLIEAADDDPDAVVQLDRRLRELAAAVDDVEYALQWPVFLEKAEKSSKNAERVIEQFDGNADDRNRLHQLREELRYAIDVGDLDLLHRYIEELDSLCFQVLDRQPAYHIARFNWIVERVQSMHNPQQADQLVTEGRRAINNNAIEALKAVNRQLLGLLPRDVQKEAKDSHTGDTMPKE